MAQRTSKTIRIFSTLEWVEKPKPRKRSAKNDNTRLPSSGLRFQEQKERQKRADDLAWQIKFALMKLHHWHDLDNPEWEALERLYKTAQMKLDGLGLV